VLYITGYADTGTAEQQTGADPLLKKPFKFSDLTNAVSLAIKRAPHEARENVVRLRGRSSCG
jgi:FixJ family two-component response regulator